MLGGFINSVKADRKEMKNATKGKDQSGRKRSFVDDAVEVFKVGEYLKVV